jgi:MFS family permease
MLSQIKGQLGQGFSWKRTFVSLKYPNYRLWFWGQMISLFGTWMQSTALGFLVFDLTHSPAYLGYVGFAAGIPIWFFMLHAGVVADRMSRRRLLMITQSAMMMLAFITAGLSFVHFIRPWHILVLSFGFGVLNAFDAPPRQAIVQELVHADDLTNAIAMNSMMFNIGVALGPAVGGLTYAFFGPAWCFTINGLSFIAVIVGLKRMALEPFTPRTHKTSIVADLKEGLRYVVTHPMIRTIISLIGIVSLFGFSFVTLMPAWAVEVLHGDATTNGLLQSVRGLGALGSAVFIASLGRFKFRGKLLTTGSFAFPLFLLGFSAIRWFPASMIVLFGAGFAQMLIMNLANSSVQTATPVNLRGRVMSIYALIFFGVMPIGSLGVGWTASKLGEPGTIIIGAAAILAFALLTFAFTPRLRHLA